MVYTSFSTNIVSRQRVEVLQRQGYCQETQNKAHVQYQKEYK